MPPRRAHEPLSLEVRADLPLVERIGNLWRIGGRDEPLVVRRSPRSRSPPTRSGSAERTGDGQESREGTMALIAPGRYRYEFPPSPSSSTFDLTGGDDWLGPLQVERVDRPSLAEIKLRVKEPGPVGRLPGRSTTRDSTWSSCPTPRSS